MKKLSLLGLALALYFTCSGQSNFGQETNRNVNFTLSITNLTSPTSPIYVGFYRPDDAFPKFGKHSLQKVITPNGNEVSQSWDDIPAGDYAIAIYQDLDGNRAMKQNLFGLPLEPYGFSTDFKAGMFSIPSFEKCKITIDQAHQEEAISLQK